MEEEGLGFSLKVNCFSFDKVLNDFAVPLCYDLSNEDEEC